MQQQQKQPENVCLSGSHNWPIFNICIFDHFSWKDLMLWKCGIKSQKNTKKHFINCIELSQTEWKHSENIFSWIKNCKKSKFWKLQANATNVLHHIYSYFLPPWQVIARAPLTSLFFYVYVWPYVYMGHFPQDGENEQIVSFFLLFWSYTVIFWFLTKLPTSLHTVLIALEHGVQGDWYF